MSANDRQLDNAFEAISWWRGLGHRTETCSVSGTGAIRELEEALAAIHHVERVIPVCSGTAALLAGLSALNVRSGSTAIIPTGVWPAAKVAAHTLGANVVELPIWTIDRIVSEVANCANAVVVSVPGDDNRDRFATITAQLAQEGIRVIEDLAALHTHPSHPSVSGHLAAISFGSGKGLDAGEGGALLTSDHELADRLERFSQHPIRQTLRGLDPTSNGLCLRMHPVAAVIALYAITHGLARFGAQP